MKTYPLTAPLFRAFTDQDPEAGQQIRQSRLAQGHNPTAFDRMIREAARHPRRTSPNYCRMSWNVFDDDSRESVHGSLVHTLDYPTAIHYFRLLLDGSAEFESAQVALRHFIWREMRWQEVRVDRFSIRREGIGYVILNLHS